MLFTRATDPLIFLSQLERAHLAAEWLPFDQSKWIDRFYEEIWWAEVAVHGGKGKNLRCRGLCNEISAWMMLRWVRGAPAKEYIAKLNTREAAGVIADWKSQRRPTPNMNDDDYFMYLMRREQVAISATSLVFPTYRHAFDRITGLNNCVVFIESSNGTDPGHALIANGIYRCLFDPNIGFIRATSSEDLRIVLSSLVHTYYEPLHRGNVALVTCR